MLVLTRNPAEGNYEVCYVENGLRHCATVATIAEAYAAQHSLQRALERDQLAVAKWDNSTMDWDGGDAA